MQQKIPPGEIKLGMYISGFGGRWRDHPFWRARFLLKSESDAQRVRESGVPYVLIDDALGLSPRKVEAAPAAASTPRQARTRKAPRRDVQAEYDAMRRSSDRDRAVALVSRSFRTMRGVMENARLGRAVRMSDVICVVDEISDSVERCPRTLLDVIRLKKKDEYTYLHSVAVCTLMVAVARFMGKGDAETREYGLAGLLHDIGKMGIPEPILNKTGKLTDIEFQTVRDHPEHGFRMLAETEGVPQMALDVVRHHHEKMNGRGYPFGLAGEDISLPARLGAICDVYDALTSNRSYKQAWTPREAVSAMWGWEGHFDHALLFTFMQSIGVFPVGMVVRLRSNRLGLILENRRRNSRTRVAAFHDLRENVPVGPEEIVIQDDMANDSIVAPIDPETLDIGDWRKHLGALLPAEGLSQAA